MYAMSIQNKNKFNSQYLKTMHKRRRGAKSRQRIYEQLCRSVKPAFYMRYLSPTIFQSPQWRSVTCMVYEQAFCIIQLQSLIHLSRTHQKALWIKTYESSPFYSFQFVNYWVFDYLHLNVADVSYFKHLSYALNKISTLLLFSHKTN